MDILRYLIFAAALFFSLYLWLHQNIQEELTSKDPVLFSIRLLQYWRRYFLR